MLFLHSRGVIPIMMLCQEHDEDPEIRSDPVSPKKREEVMVQMAAGLVGAYRYFQQNREVGGGSKFTSRRPMRTAPKVGRNEPCPCGSGKMHKKCCGRVTVH